MMNSMTLSISAFDQQMMIRALQLAEKGLNTTTPNPRVGCVIVNDKKDIVGEGFHAQCGQDHAEILALGDAGESARGGTAYVTLEPCCHQGKTPPCASALIEAGIKRVVYGMEDPNPRVSGTGLEQLENAGIAVDGPVEEEAARDLNKGFIKRMTRGLPYVRIKSAMSVDGRTAMESGESKWITGPRARADVQLLRARSCAIISGVESIIHDDPALTVRLGEGDRQPLRVIVDTHGRCPAKAQALDGGSRTIIACSENTDIKKDALSELSREHWPLPERHGRVSLYHLMRRLAEEGCNEVLVESGAVLSGAFLAAGMVDELIIYMAPKLMGAKARPLFDLSINKMISSLPLTITDIRAVGPDWRITAYPDPDG